MIKRSFGLWRNSTARILVSTTILGTVALFSDSAVRAADGATSGGSGSASLAASAISTNGMSLREVLERVLEYNESVQMRALEWLASQKRAQAARGIFEPEFVGSMDAQGNERRNSVQQQLGLFGSDAFDERNLIYSGAVESLAPTGAKVRLGYSLRNLSNNLQERYGTGANEYESFMGLSVVQPLLKNGGRDVTLAAIRLAAGESSLAFQEYRRQMMLVVARSETAYWDLHAAQQLFSIRSDSVRIARALLDDNRARVQAGKSSELEVLEAQAGVSLRTARQRDALQKLVEANNRLSAMFSGSSGYTNLSYSAKDAPQVRQITVDFFDGMTEAIDWNPDYLAQRQQVIQENIRLAYAKNQRYPQLDLKGSYGLAGLGEDPGSSWDEIQTSDYESWSVGFELRIPLGGGAKARYEMEAVKLRKQQAILGLKSVEVELSSALNTAMQRVGSARESVVNYEDVVAFNRRLLDTELASLELGKTDSRKVLEAEEKLSDARSMVTESQVNFEKSLLEWALVRGAILRERNLEIEKEDLARKTGMLAAGGKWTDIDYNLLMKRSGAEYDRHSREAKVREASELTETLRRRLSELPPAAPPNKPAATPDSLKR